MLNASDFEEIASFIKEYRPEPGDEGLCFRVMVTDAFINRVDAVFAIVPDFLTFRLEKIHAYESLKLLKEKVISVSVDTGILQNHGLEIYEDWPSFLRKIKNRLKSPSFFYVISDDSLFPRDREEHKVRHYLDIIALVEILCDNCDFRSSDTRLVFLHKSNLEFEIDFGEPEVDAGLDGITIFQEMFKGEEHTGQKKSLLKESLYNMIANVNEKFRFKNLLNNFGSFSTQITQSYHLFVSEFSFDDVRREYEEKTREYVFEINKIFADVQTKMLGVPAILALAAFRFSTISQPNQWIPNLIILVAVLVYLHMMIYLIRSQDDTLLAIKREIKSQMKRFRKDYQKEGRLLHIFEDNLEQRCEKQRVALKNFYWVMGLLFLVTISLFVWSACKEFYSDEKVEKPIVSQESTLNDNLVRPKNKKENLAVGNSDTLNEASQKINVNFQKTVDEPSDGNRDSSP